MCTNFHQLSNFVKMRLPTSKTFSIPPVEVNTIYNEITKLDANKSPGTDNIGPRILKISAQIIATSLTYIFNRIIDTGTYPKILKNAKVTPVFKTGERFLASNYRPISVLPTLTKLIEKHLSQHLYKFLIKFNLLHPAQSGFRPNHSCQTALINIIDKWLQEINNGNINLAVLLDFQKAFDVVDHEILCSKLKIYGFDKNSIALFKSYLHGRTQQVQIGNTKSDQLPINFGVPQGSILGPLLFIIYINDLPLYIKNCQTDMYADDSTIHTSGSNIKELQVKIQQDLNCVEQWCHENNMFINSNKTKCMIIGTRQKLSSQENELCLTISSNKLQNSTCEKLLGIKVDQQLNWSSQVDVVCSTISSRIYLLSKIKQYLNLELRKLFYNGYILPLIDYCCIIWGSCNNEGLNRILKLQKRAARLIMDADPLTPSEPLFKYLGWMKI